MSVIVTTPLSLCSDCLDAVEFTDDELGYTPGTLFGHFLKMTANRPDLPIAAGRFVNTDASFGFAASDCEGCGSPLHGDRFPYELIVEQKPRHLHDCSNCTFLGWHDDFDMYVCQDKEVVVRAESEGSSYYSVSRFFWTEINATLSPAYAALAAAVTVVTS